MRYSFLFFLNVLICSNHSRFKPCNSCIVQLVRIIHEIYESFVAGHEVRGVFLDISKTFEKVWHEAIILKLTQNGIWENLLKLLNDFLKERTQRVVKSPHITAEVPQDSILGSLFFLTYMNDLSEGLSTNNQLFGDDICLFFVIRERQTSANDLNKY